MSTTLKQGCHAGRRWVIKHNMLGYRCGYVECPEELYNEDFDVHGGITYAGFLLGKSFYIGFDCAHAGDSPDPSLPGYRPSKVAGVIRDDDYVEAECKSLCEQVTLRANGPSIKSQLDAIEVLMGIRSEIGDVKAMNYLSNILKRDTELLQQLRS